MARNKSQNDYQKRKTNVIGRKSFVEQWDIILKNNQ